MTKEELYNEYWALREQGEGIIGGHRVLHERYGIPFKYMTIITHPKGYQH